MSWVRELPKQSWRDGDPVMSINCNGSLLRNGNVGSITSIYPDPTRQTERRYHCSREGLNSTQ